MLVDEMPQSFVKKNNNYSHCPLKKRPVHVMLSEEISVTKKEEMIDEVIVDDIPEPENLSTKPEDLSKTAEKHRSRFSRSPSPATVQSIFGKRAMSPMKSCAPLSPLRISSQFQQQEQQQQQQQHYHNQQQHHRHSPSPSHPSYSYPHCPTKAITPPVGVAPIHPVAKKARVEVIQHDHASSPVAVAAPMHFMATKTPLEPLNLNTPIEPLAHYATPAWARTAPLYPPHYLPYPAYRYHHHSGTELYPSYPVPAYPHSSPEHSSVSPPPHAALTCPTIQRPIARSYTHWASPDQCGLSPTSSLGSGSGSLRSPPPPVTPEDLSSPGSDSGRSSAGSTSAGPAVINQKLEKPPSTNNSSTSPSSPRYSCPDCGKSYSTYSGLSKHQQFHCASAEGQAKKSFSCKYCEKVYVSLGALKMHIRTHTLPCKCHLCGKAFSRPWLLQGHIRTHTGEKPFSCQHCNRAFADRSNLRAHLQTHSDVKKYSCPSCSKTFSRMSLLTKHQEGGCPGVSVSMGFTC